MNVQGIRLVSTDKSSYRVYVYESLKNPYFEFSYVKECSILILVQLCGYCSHFLMISFVIFLAKRLGSTPSFRKLFSGHLY